MLMGRICGGLHDALPLPRPVVAPAGFDAYDQPTILLAGDGLPALDLRATLQSLGFEVLDGPALLDSDVDPFLVVTEAFLAAPANRSRFDRIRSQVPQARVFRVAGPADAVSQLIPALS